MAIQNKGWAYVSGSEAGTPGGANTNIQFNNNGILSGSSLLITDGSGSLSASLNISASAFYGNGANLTGVTASAVNVADGPEQAIQFRVDTPVSGEISGSSALMFLTGSNTLSGTYAAFTAVTASTIAGGSPLTISSSTTQVYGPMQIQSGDSLSFNGASDTAKITHNGSNLDFNSPGNIILNSGNNNISSSANISASAFYANGTKLTSGGGGGGIFTEIDSLKAYTTSSLSVGHDGDPGATLHVSSSNNNVSFRVDNTQSHAKGPALFVTGARGDGTAVQCLGIGTDSPSQALDVNGYITLGSSGGGYILVNGDTDTWIRFGHSGADSMQFKAGNVNFLEFDENGLDHALFNSASADVNFHVRTAANSASLFVEGDTGNIGMGTGSPKTALDVHHTGSSDPTNLATDTGGGEVVYFGTASAGLTAGHLYFLNVSGGWASGSAADSSYGATSMLGISLGTNPADHGMLTRGYFNADTMLSNFITGSVLYMGETSGTLSTTAPSATGDIVRIVGHCGASPNIIYFNPAPGWIEIA